MRWCEKNATGAVAKIVPAAVAACEGDNDQRVRYFAISAIAQMIQTFDGKVQKVHSVIIPVIVLHCILNLKVGIAVMYMLQVLPRPVICEPRKVPIGVVATLL